MGLIDSPQFDDRGQIIEEMPEHEPDRRRRRFRLTIAGLLALNVLLVLSLLISDAQPIVRMTGAATIRGQVVDEQGRPLAEAHVYVEGMAFSVVTDADGQFVIEQVPVDDVVLVVGVTPQPPQFIDIVVRVQGEQNIGQVVYRAASDE